MKKCKRLVREEQEKQIAKLDELAEKDDKEWEQHPENFYVGEEAWKAIKRL